MDDSKIIELYNARDEKAIEETATKYGEYCLRIALNILSVHADAEECVNDTYLRTWESIPPQKPNSLKLFLARITRNLAFNRHRAEHTQKRGGTQITLALHEIDEVTPSLEQIDERLRAEELLASLQAFLRALPERERSIFILRYFHVQSTQYIAAEYGIREGNVLKTLSRTRQKLKKHLEKEGFSV